MVADFEQGILHIWEEMLPIDTKKVTLETEIELINVAVGGKQNLIPVV
jgi:hypothetical protein